MLKSSMMILLTWSWLILLLLLFKAEGTILGHKTIPAWSPRWLVGVGHFEKTWQNTSFEPTQLIFFLFLFSWTKSSLFSSNNTLKHYKDEKRNRHFLQKEDTFGFFFPIALMQTLFEDIESLKFKCREIKLAAPSPSLMDYYISPMLLCLTRN